MFNIIPEILIYLLAVYGMLSLVISVVDSITQHKTTKNSDAKLVLIVKNQQDTVEGLVRGMLTGGAIRNIIMNGKLNIIDMGSNDDTLQILTKLKNSYDVIDIYNKTERNEIFKDFADNEKRALGKE
ncbi:MAG: hypothetical protein Q8942_00265 [Bacillota bacterium]|nr:hypothetical protein [Bacillota bacterium]